MTSASIFPNPSTTPRSRRSLRRAAWFSVKHGGLVALLGLQSACSLLIEVDDAPEVDRDASVGGSSNAPDAALAASAGSAGEVGLAGSGGASSVASESDAGLLGADDAGLDAEAGDATQLDPPPTFDLAFIEAPAGSAATLQLVSTALALASQQTQAEPGWRKSLLPADPAGDVLDFRWSPDGQRIAARYATSRGNQIAIFTAESGRELARQEASSQVMLPNLEATANYRWSPRGDALAVELSGGEGPMLGGYVIDGEGAFGLPPVAFSGPIATMDWLSPTSLYVIQPENDEPELIELRLNQGAFELPRTLPVLGLFFPLELRHVPGGLIAGSDDPTNFLFFWPDSPEHGAEAAARPSAYLSGRQSFVADVGDTPDALIYRIGEPASPIASVPDCATVLAWTEGPDRRSLAGSRLACLTLEDATPTIRVHSYAEDGARTATVLDDETLRADFVSSDSWERHARGFSARGEFLALATSAHDILIDLRGASPKYQINENPAPGNTARGFSPSGQALLQQRGRRVELVVLSPASDVESLLYPLPDAAVDLPECLTAHHADNWCGAPSAARRAAARWSRESDVVALAASDGLDVLAAVPAVPSTRVVHVSSCAGSCVRQYEFGR